MSIPQIKLFLVIAVGWAVGSSAGAWAGSKEEAPLHWSGEKTVWDRKNNRVELFGKAAVNQPGETLVADYVLLDLNTRTLDARGNCVYVTSGTVMYGEEMHFNLDTRTGVIVSGKVSGEQFTLSGERINRLSSTRFQTHRGEYSTCFDCPFSWTLAGRDVDMEVGEYAVMESVTTKIKDTPVAWSPLLLIPIKTQRQTGFLFPQWGTVSNPSGLGFWFVQPFFWAIHRSADMTVAVGTVSGRGLKTQWEGRYALAPRSNGSAVVHYLKDELFVQKPTRWALNIAQTQELPFRVDQKLRVVAAGDNLIHNNVNPGLGVPDNGGAYLKSEAMVSRSGVMSGYLAVRRFRGLLHGLKEKDPNGDSVNFDQRTVQVVPTASLNMNDYFLFNSPLAVGFTTNFSKFDRSGPLFDIDPGLRDPNGAKELGVSVVNTTPDGKPITFGVDQPILGVDPIRRATRFTAIPALYTTLRPMGYFSVVPSLQYRNYFYQFEQNIPALARSYFLYQTDFSTQLEKIYDAQDADFPKLKHLVRPTLTYSFIPPRWIHEDHQHPFTQQMRFAQSNGLSGYNFDNNDIVPLNPSYAYTNYFAPLGNSLTYGFTTQVIRKKKADSKLPGPVYQQAFEFRANQTYNLRGGDKPFSMFQSAATLTLTRLSAGAAYDYLPYVPISRDPKTGQLRGRQNFNVGVGYLFEKALHQSVMIFERSVSLGYSRTTLGSSSSKLVASLTYSISDYLMPSVSWGYDFAFPEPAKRLANVNARMKFQSPSRCWSLDIIGDAAPQEGRGLVPAFRVEWALNLTGAGFASVGDTVGAIATRGQ